MRGALFVGILLVPLAAAEPVEQHVHAGVLGAGAFFDQRRTAGSWWGVNETELDAGAEAAAPDGTRVDASVSLDQVSSWWRPSPGFEMRDDATDLRIVAGADTAAGRVGADLAWAQRVVEVNGLAVCARDDLTLVAHEGPLGSSTYERDADCLVRFPTLP